MSIKQRLLNAVSTHPKLVTFGIGFVITMAVGTAIGMVDHSAMAAVGISQHNSAKTHP